MHQNFVESSDILKIYVISAKWIIISLVLSDVSTSSSFFLFFSSICAFCRQYLFFFLILLNDYSENISNFNFFSVFFFSILKKIVCKIAFDPFFVKNAKDVLRYWRNMSNRTHQILLYLVPNVFLSNFRSLKSFPKSFLESCRLLCASRAIAATPLNLILFNYNSVILSNIFSLRILSPLIYWVEK